MDYVMLSHGQAYVTQTGRIFKVRFVYFVQNCWTTEIQSEEQSQKLDEERQIFDANWPT